MVKTEVPPDAIVPGAKALAIVTLLAGDTITLAVAVLPLPALVEPTAPVVLVIVVALVP